MKRVLLSITGTVLGLVALLSFKSNAHPISSGAALPSAALPGSSSSSSAGGATPSGSSAPPDPAGSSSTPGRSPASATAKTVAGDAIQTQYGVVQVQITVSGKKITNASFLQLTAYDGHSAQINNAAAPILLQETLAAQSANIDTVSGASYTTQGYEQSLQSALDKAGIQ
jgi:uncharacterized protein with FMN-binding domain